MKVAEVISEFVKVKKAIEEHLFAINENSLEISSLFDYLQDVEEKMDRLSARLDQLQLSSVPSEKKIGSLTERERLLFAQLYTAEKALSYHDLAKRCNCSHSEVSSGINSLASKGVLFSRQLLHKKMLISLDSNFKERQAKENLVNLSLETFL